ncbi:hypothetical protein [Evansella clarkii]|jgi:hypothetical protein|uniref:hypothetical protein n=1 Tax=Evansella clarkii TaxID=79879 RepID=UPI000997B52C|nr:hypothetical protein [Evansella clarkii]
MKKQETGIQRGQAITFRLPSDTPDHILQKLQRLKETERRNFSSKIAQFVLEGVSDSLGKERETVTIPLPKQLSKEQRNWLKHTHSEALLGNVVYHLLADPVRAASVLASLNSNALSIEEALYLQEDEAGEAAEDHHAAPLRNTEENVLSPQLTRVDKIDEDLENFDWNKVREEQAATSDNEAEKEESSDDLLGDFLAQMNK